VQRCDFLERVAKEVEKLEEEMAVVDALTTVWILTLVEFL